MGGTLAVSLVETHASPRAGGGPLRSPMHRILADLQRTSKVSSAQPSDEAETFKLDVRWEPTPGALGRHNTSRVDACSNTIVDCGKHFNP